MDETKYYDAITLGLAIVEAEDLLITEDDLVRWRAARLFEWLEAWGFEWENNGWRRI